MAKQQTESNVRNLSGLQAIREKPTRFIGEADSQGMWTCLREVLDNTVDEHGAARNTLCRLIADPSKKLAYYIVDAGGGMPTGTITVENPIDHSKVKVSALKALTGLTSTGSKFDSDAYGTARGCFIGETLVHTVHKGAVPIELLYKANSGALTVPSYRSDPFVKTWVNVSKVHLTKHTRHLTRVSFYHGDGKPITSTPDHPYYVWPLHGSVPEKVEAQHLKPGQTLVTKGLHQVTVKAVEDITLDEPVPVYDLTVDETHCYFVGSVGVLVSNTHGEGIKATNAMSNEFTVWTYRERKWWTISYAKGVETKPVTTCKAPTLPDGTTPKKGTIVYVNLDPSVFNRGSSVLEDDIFKWFRITSAFAEGLNLSYRDRKGEEHEWVGQGPEVYLDEQLELLKATKVEDAVCVSTGSWFDFVLTFTDYDGISVDGFVNGLHNPSGGTHVSTVYDAVYNALSAHVKRGHAFKPTDIREGLVGAINVKLTAAKFSNQIKETLKDERAGAPLYEELFPVLEEFFAANKKLAATLCDRATQMAALKKDFQQNKRVMKVLTTARKRGNLPNKLASAPSCLAEDRELYLVEGDSAGGSAKLARDASYQEVLPLKGKIPNPFGCFTADTLVSTTVGHLPFARLAEDYRKGTLYEGLAWDAHKQTFTSVTLQFPRITKYVSSLVELEFDTGVTVRCTPDHLFLLETGEYRRADSLTESDFIREFPHVAADSPT